MMISHDHRSAARADFDVIIRKTADYVLDYDVSRSSQAMETARYCFLDTVGCGLLALNYPACTKMLGPCVPGFGHPEGVRVPGTSYRLDPIEAAFNIGAMVRWLDFNDTWLAAEWGHPSDNLGGILAIADYLSLKAERKGKAPLKMKDVLEAMVKAHEIQGVLALENCFNRVGLDHVMLVRIATTGVVAAMLGGNRQEVMNALSHAWVDGCSLRTYRHAPNAGPRKSWAAGDATARGTRLAFIAMTGEIGYPSAVTAKGWGFQDASFRAREVKLAQEYGTYVMENILFKISFPAEFHAQTAVECAVKLHPQVKDRIEAVERICIETQESAVRIIDKTGPLDNPADRDHCLQYMTAVGLLKGDLKAEDYEDAAAVSTVDDLREKMEVKELERFTTEYLDPDKRSIGNAVQVFFKDGSQTERVSVDYPIGHRFRREEGIPVLKRKFENNCATILSPKQCKALFELAYDQGTFEATDVTAMMEILSLR